MGLISSVLAEIEYRDMKHVAKINKKAQEKAIVDYNKKRSQADWETKHAAIGNKEFVHPNWKDLSPAGMISHNIPDMIKELRYQFIEAKWFSKALIKADKTLGYKSQWNNGDLDELHNKYSWSGDGEKLIKMTAEEVKRQSKIYLERFKHLQDVVSEFGTKKEKKIMAESTDIISNKLVPALDNMIELLNDKQNELAKSQAELNSGKNVANNDPQKAEKLAKIAKLQRELDSLKSEVSEDFEPEIVDKNN